MLKAFDNRTLHCRGIVTAAQQAYNKYYEAEIELNETFNRFASNFCLAYQGPNKASAQIGSKFDTSESVVTVELSAIAMPWLEKWLILIFISGQDLATHTLSNLP